MDEAVDDTSRRLARRGVSGICYGIRQAGGM